MEARQSRERSIETGSRLIDEEESSKRGGFSTTDARLHKDQKRARRGLKQAKQDK